MKWAEIVKKSPNGVIVVCVTLLLIAILASLTLLSSTGKDAAEISRFVNTILNFLTVAGVVTTGVVAGSAATSAQEAKDLAQQTVDQTNGPMTEKFAALEAQLNELAARNATVDADPDQDRIPGL